MDLPYREGILSARCQATNSCTAYSQRQIARARDDFKMKVVCRAADAYTNGAAL